MIQNEPILPRSTKNSFKSRQLALVLADQFGGFFQRCIRNNKENLDFDSSTICSDFLGNSPLLKHLGEAGLLHDVSALLARARSRDEGNLRKIQTQAKGASLLKCFSCRSSNVYCYLLPIFFMPLNVGSLALLVSTKYLIPVPLRIFDCLYCTMYRLHLATKPGNSRIFAPIFAPPPNNNCSSI